jgi:DNA polymerase
VLTDGPMIDAHRVTLSAEDDFDGWRDAARGLAEAGVPPSAIVWQVEGATGDLFGGPDTSPPPAGPSFPVPRAFVDLARKAICHSDPERFALLYAMLLKLRVNRRAMEDRADPLLDRLEAMAKEVRRDLHKMHAFVRFREVADDAGPRFVAFFEPDHHIVGELLAGAQKREAAMIETSRSQEPMPQSNLQASWDALKAEAAACTRCDLYKCGTQTVFGEGPLSASILFVGEQPGDQEDLAGRPFIGPAGQLFDAALAEAGIDRATTYVTNAVKHFKFVARGKRRIHAKPDGGEIQACHWWLDRERELIRPPLTVALGATAARSLIGKVVTISKVRGAPLTLADGSSCWVTVHPSFLLRMPDEEARRTERAAFVDDLKRIRDHAATLVG